MESVLDQRDIMGQALRGGVRQIVRPVALTHRQEFCVIGFCQILCLHNPAQRVALPAGRSSDQSRMICKAVLGGVAVSSMAEGLRSRCRDQADVAVVALAAPAGNYNNPL